MRYFTLMLRALCLRCPVCGQGKLFRNWFLMYEICSCCGIRFNREPGFFLGSIYINYGLTSLIVAVFYPILMFSKVASNQMLLGITLVFVVLFPMWFFRYARSYWLAFDQFWDPREDVPESKKPSKAD